MRSSLPFPNNLSWEKLGRIVAPNPRIPWMSTFTGSSFALPVEGGPLCDVYVTGRDDKNRSRIGKIRINLADPAKAPEIGPEPLLTLGDLGAFDENGTAYPCLLEHGGRVLLYYVGWMPTVLTPYQCHIGLAALEPGGTFKRLSRAPVVERTDTDYLSLGSCFVMEDEGKFRMWYTSYLSWGKAPGEPKHTYVIKYGESKDGLRWERCDEISIGIQNKGEFAICRPSVVKDAGRYHMWYAVRGGEYRIGYAFSEDAVHWTRRDDLSGITVSASGWDSKALTYPHVFSCRGHYYMLYNGNEYGKEGLGLARLRP
ncbi:MAG TPA: hypothetical protein VJ873_12305 [bacterium]|nr:hypothetical protein [bacterium]